VRSSFALLAVALLVVVASGCHRGQVRIPRDPNADGHVWRDPIDPEAYGALARGLLYTAEPPVGYAEARNKPVQVLAITLRLNWNVAVRPLPEAFEQLCESHNKAAIALSEFTRRENELLTVLHHLTALKAELDVLLADYEARLSVTGPGAPDADTVTPATQAREINARAAARVADILPPDAAPRARETTAANPVPP